MALFKFKKQGKENQERAKEGQFTAERRPTESLGSVLSESVPGAALDIIRSNSAFGLSADADGNMQYMVVTIDVNTIGGLNKRTARQNSDKGQLIECINCGNIEAYVSAEGIAADKFVIIPTEKTVESLSEFRFISDREKFSLFIPTICIVDQNGNMAFHELPVTVPYEWFYDISRGVVSISDAVARFSSDEFVAGAAPSDDILFGENDDIQNVKAEVSKAETKESNDEDVIERAQRIIEERVWRYQRK